MQKLIQNVAKCKKLKSMSRKHGSLKFEPVSYVSTSMWEYTRLLFYGGHTVSGLRVYSFSVSTSETILKHTCSVRTSETTLPKYAYSGGVCVDTDTLSASFGYVRVTVMVFTVTFHFLWNRSPALPSCKELAWNRLLIITYTPIHIYLCCDSKRNFLVF